VKFLFSIMRKCLLFVALLIVSQLNHIKAQSLFGAPDTICIRQPVVLTDSVVASTYYWGFCSGYLANPPVINNLGTMADFNLPGGIEIAKEGDQYYGFVANTGSNELLRLDFGNSLANTPAITNFGTLNNTMPQGPMELFLIKDSASNNWFMFATGGIDLATSSLTRIDFGASLANVPNSVGFGNLGGLLNGPRGIMVFKQDTAYIGYIANNADDKLIRLRFGSNISLTPTLQDLGALFSLDEPTDMVAVMEAANWFFFVTNKASNSITRLDFGSSLLNFPLPVSLGTLGNTMTEPSALTYVADCNGRHFFVTNGAAVDITRVDAVNVTGPYTGVPLPNTTTFAAPMGISKVIRERDNLYAYVTNSGDNTLTQVLFPQCTTASITSSTSSNPPVYRYETPGTYNVYLAINEGLPNMQVECKQIVVLPYPVLILSNDTIICQGDTIEFFLQAFGAQSITWSPYYNISDTTIYNPRVWPEYSTDYRLKLPYANGCIVDTGVFVEVRKNKADAGPDRTLVDGARTLLGGPITSEGEQYSYAWTPNQFITDVSITNPVVNPPYDFTYYLEVRNDFGCYDIDTVVVRVTCNDLNLPNAFSPESKNPLSNRFGVMNKQIIKLNYLRVFDRWGKRVFESTDVTRQWDGRVNGEPAPFGVYIWEADGFCIEGKRFKRSGNVTLIR
jgi:gliding motility-associated-like protein